MLTHEPWDYLFNLVLIETWNTCNRKCWFCKFGQLRSEPRSKMTTETVHNLIGQLSDIQYDRRISWVGINEPLLDRRLPEFIRLARRTLPSCYQSTITNGDLLNVEMYDRLIDAGLNSIAISVYDDQANFRAEALKSSRTDVIIWDKRSYRDHEWFVLNSGDFTNRAGALPVVEISHLDLPCYKTHTGVSVLPNGDVPLCSDDMYGDVLMGNISTERLVDIWMGSKFSHYRSRLWRSRHGLKLCEKCTNKGGPHVVRFP